MENSIYGDHIADMERIMDDMIRRIDVFRTDSAKEHGFDPVEHVEGRIKTEESMRAKCRDRGLPETEESALRIITDAIGIRIVCAFIDDVFLIRNHIASFEDITVATEKDYIRNAKENGYRSYHMILMTADGYYIEVQLRTISMDTWAALEHQMRYKKELSGSRELIGRELKRCADELASTDVSMQAIRNMINGMSQDAEDKNETAAG